MAASDGPFFAPSAAIADRRLAYGGGQLMSVAAAAAAASSSVIGNSHPYHLQRHHRQTDEDQTGGPVHLPHSHQLILQQQFHQLLQQQQHQQHQHHRHHHETQQQQQQQQQQQPEVKQMHVPSLVVGGRPHHLNHQYAMSNGTTGHVLPFSVVDEDEDERDVDHKTFLSPGSSNDSDERRRHIGNDAAMEYCGGEGFYGRRTSATVVDDYADFGSTSSAVGGYYGSYRNNEIVSASRYDADDGASYFHLPPSAADCGASSKWCQQPYAYAGAGKYDDFRSPVVVPSATSDFIRAMVSSSMAAGSSSSGSSASERSPGANGACIGASTTAQHHVRPHQQSKLAGVTERRASSSADLDDGSAMMMSMTSSSMKHSGNGIASAVGFRRQNDTTDTMVHDVMTAAGFAATGNSDGTMTAATTTTTLAADCRSVTSSAAQVTPASKSPPVVFYPWMRKIHSKSQNSGELIYRFGAGYAIVAQCDTIYLWLQTTAAVRQCLCYCRYNKANNA